MAEVVAAAKKPLPDPPVSRGPEKATAVDETIFCSRGVVPCLSGYPISGSCGKLRGSPLRKHVSNWDSRTAHIMMRLGILRACRISGSRRCMGRCSYRLMVIEKVNPIVRPSSVNVAPKMRPGSAPPASKSYFLLGTEETSHPAAKAGRTIGQA
jgi:hypothetical protein